MVPTRQIRTGERPVSTPRAATAKDPPAVELSTVSAATESNGASSQGVNGSHGVKGQQERGSSGAGYVKGADENV